MSDETKTDYQTLNDGCSGDSEGLAVALGTGYRVLAEDMDEQGYGHHTSDAIFRLADGRYVHAECGGCSCEGSGSWSYVADVGEAMLLVPEHRRSRMAIVEAYLP